MKYVKGSIKHDSCMRILLILLIAISLGIGFEIIVKTGVEHYFSTDIETSILGWYLLPGAMVVVALLSFLEDNFIKDCKKKQWR